MNKKHRALTITKAGERMTFRPAHFSDAEKISQLIQDNFLHSPDYAFLTTAQKEAYCALNTPQKITKKLNDPLNIITSVLENTSGTIVGCRIVKKELIELHNEPVFVGSGKRLHVAREYVGRGLGLWMSLLSETLLMDMGIEYLLGIPSNNHILKSMRRNGYMPFGKKKVNKSEVQILIKSLHNQIHIMELVLENGTTVYASEVTVDDLGDISDLLKSNFESSPVYSHLTETEAAGYVALNTKEKLEKKLSDPTNIVCHLVRDTNGSCVGYRLTQQRTHDTYGVVASGQRLHVAPSHLDTDLEKQLIILGEKSAKEQGIKRATAVPSNDHVHQLFSSLGYKQVSVHSTDSLKSRGVEREVPFMVKEL